jgi:ArsR family transcriptional regulator, arsenate/arsenite/antimonite-responsive transcriptional repressor
MDEVIVRVTRTVACATRLRILSVLARQRECAPSELARRLGLGMDSVCVHLKHLAIAGLIQRRRSGVWCYGVAASPYPERTFSGNVAKWLYALLCDPARAIGGSVADQLRSSGSLTVEGRLHGVLFEAATAFSNARRLQLLRRLQKGPATAEALSQELSMSRPALSRHTAKLIRRGYVQTDRTRRGVTYRLNGSPKSAIHGGLLAFVTAEWKGRTSGVDQLRKSVMETARS